MSEPLVKSLVPPRPNLGPESWPKGPRLEVIWLALAISAAALLTGFVWRLARRRAARSRPGVATSDQVDATPRGRLVALSMDVKNALAARFGSTWRAKTTEELAAEAALAEVLGPEPLTELVQFLDRIDRLKFAPERPNRERQALQDELASWNPRIAVLIARIEARANVRRDKPVFRSGPAGAVVPRG